MRIRLFTCFFLLLTQFVFAQEQIHLKMKLTDYPKQKFLLLTGDEGGVYLLDTLQADYFGNIDYKWQGEFGFYRLQRGDDFIDFRMNQAEYEFSLEGNFSEGELVFPQGDENNQYQYYKTEFDLLNQDLHDYQEKLQNLTQSDSLYKLTYTAYKNQKKAKRDLMKDLWNRHIDNSWAARFALAQQELCLDFDANKQKAKQYQIKHYFDYFSFSDSLLCGTPIYYEKIGKYLELQDFDRLVMDQNLKKIKQIIETLFWFSELDPASQKYLANYLMNKYPEEEYEEVYHIILDAYKVLNACEYVLSSKVIQNRVKRYRNMRIGQQVQDIELINCLDERIQSLGNVNSDLTLLIMWSTDCDQSIRLLNRIKTLYPFYNELGLEIVAVSLDRNMRHWHQMVQDNSYNWVNACDSDGLMGKTASSFNIYVTPTMFLIDQSLRIVSMPQTYFQLEKKLNEVFK